MYARPNIKKDHMISLASVKDYIEKNSLDVEIIEQAEIQIKYRGTLKKKK